MNDFMPLKVYLDRLCRQQPSFGAAVVIMREAKITFACAFGKYDEHSLTLDTPLPVASLSKPVFACLVLKLAEQGLLDLDTPLAKLLPTSYLPDEPYLPLMTARHALSHTTGFPNWRGESGLRADFPPGSAFQYSTEGLLYLQAVVEHLLGRQSISDCFQENILTPFGMAASRLVPEDLSAWRPGLPGGLHPYAALGLHTTAPDYAQFMIAMLKPGRADEALGVPSIPTQMLTPHIRVGDQAQLFWGLGWGLQHAEPQDSYFHFGVKSGRTFNFALGYPAEQSGVLILTSQSVGFSVCEDIAQIVLGDIRPLPAFRWLLPPQQWRADGRKLSGA